MSCCTNIYSQGCYSSCETTQIANLVADATGIYTIEVTFAGQVFTLPQTFNLGEEITIDLSKFNENASLIIKVKDTNGDYMEDTIDLTTYDCFKINTQVRIAIA